MARICIVTPSALGSNPRVVKEAAALTGVGHGVDVIATRTLDHVDTRDNDILATAQWCAHCLDLRARTPRLVRRALQMAYAGGFKLTNHQYCADRGSSPFTLPLVSKALQIPADLYIAHYPPALPAAAMAAKKHGALFAFDAEDYHPGDLTDEACHQDTKRLIAAIERKYLPAAAYVSAASPGIAKAYTNEYGIEQSTVVLNVFPLSDAPLEPTARGTAQPGPSLYWFSQTIGPDRGLECAVRAIGKAKTRPHLYLRGNPAAGFQKMLIDIARANSVADRLHFLAPAPPSEMVKLAAQYDIGLAAETGCSENRRIALTNKQFTYLLAGIPSLLSDIPAHLEIQNSMDGAGFIYAKGDPGSLAHQIDHLLGDPGKLSAARTQAYELGQSRFNMDVEQANLIEVVANALASSPNGHSPHV